MADRRTLALGVVAILLASMLAGAGTFAYFSDVETSTGNTFTAGTLDLKVDGGDNPVAINVADIYPGWSSTYTWKLKNTGSIAGKLSIKFSAITNDDNGLTEPESTVDTTGGPLGGGELGANLCCRINSPGTGSNAYLNNRGGKTVVADVLLAPGAEVSFSMGLYILSGVGNVIQSDSVKFDIIFRLDQVTP